MLNMFGNSNLQKATERRGIGRIGPKYDIEWRKVDDIMKGRLEKLRKRMLRMKFQSFLRTCRNISHLG